LFYAKLDPDLIKFT